MKTNRFKQWKEFVGDEGFLLSLLQKTHFSGVEFIAKSSNGAELPRSFCFSCGFNDKEVKNRCPSCNDRLLNFDYKYARGYVGEAPYVQKDSFSLRVYGVEYILDCLSDNRYMSLNAEERLTFEVRKNFDGSFTSTWLNDSNRYSILDEVFMEEIYDYIPGLREVMNAFGNHPSLINVHYAIVGMNQVPQFCNPDFIKKYPVFMNRVLGRSSRANEWCGEKINVDYIPESSPFWFDSNESIDNTTSFEDFVWRMGVPPEIEDLDRYIKEKCTYYNKSFNVNLRTLLQSDLGPFVIHRWKNQLYPTRVIESFGDSYQRLLQNGFLYLFEGYVKGRIDCNIDIQDLPSKFLFDIQRLLEMGYIPDVELLRPRVCNSLINQVKFNVKEDFEGDITEEIQKNPLKMLQNFVNEE